MAEFLNLNNNDWKQSLRNHLIAGFNGNPQNDDGLDDGFYEQIGYYYMCCAPKFLYRYYGGTPEKLAIVKTNQMWYSAPCNFNDIFDCDISIDTKVLFDSALKLAPDKKSIRPGSPMWYQLKQNLNEEINSLKNTFTDMKKSMGISCFSEVEDSLLMWAHYANNHSGMCIEYNLLEITKSLGFSPIPIIYTEDKPCFSSLKEETLNTEINAVFIKGITSKSPEWSYEKEWRIIRDDGACGDKWDSEKNGAMLNMIPPSSIILGCMAKPDFEKDVREYCKNSKINLYKMEKDTCIYGLKKIPILWFDK